MHVDVYVHQLFDLVNTALDNAIDHRIILGNKRANRKAVTFANLTLLRLVTAKRIAAKQHILDIAGRLHMIQLTRLPVVNEQVGRVVFAIVSAFGKLIDQERRIFFRHDPGLNAGRLNTDGAHNPVTGRVLQRGDILSLNTFPMISGYYTALERTMFVETVDPASLAYWEANIAAHELGMRLLKPGVSCAEVTAGVNALFEERDLLQYRSFGYGHSFGVLSHYYGREAGLELREDIDTVLEQGMVISMEPMITIPEGQPGAGGYREHDILVVGEVGAQNITKFPFGPEHNIVKG